MILDGKSSILKGPFLVIHFSYYTLITFLLMLSVILLALLILELPSELEFDLQDLGRKWLVDFNAGKLI